MKIHWKKDFSFPFALYSLESGRQPRKEKCNKSEGEIFPVGKSAEKARFNICLVVRVVLLVLATHE